MQVRYYDECRWVDIGDGLMWQFVDEEAEPLAEVALKDGEAQLWKFQVNVPERYQWNGTKPAGIVCSQAAAKKVAEMILMNTIVRR